MPPALPASRIQVFNIFLAFFPHDKAKNAATVFYSKSWVSNGSD